MTAKITTLIDRARTFRVVADQIASILLLETAHQQELALQAGQDPNLWKLRVFQRRSEPWAVFQETPEKPAEDTSPIVNITLDNKRADRSRSNVVERQTVSAIYNLDCYGYGTAGASETGHDAGDELAEDAVYNAAALVENILMAGTYTYLGLRGTVGLRWIESTTIFRPQLDNQAIQHVIGARVALQVDFNEFSPQVVGQPLELIALTVKRPGGQVLLQAEYSSEE